MAFLENKNLTVVRKGGDLPAIPFEAIHSKILGKNYTLTVIFCSPQESRERNLAYREKDYPTNILSFPLDESEGEIYICLSIARRDAKKFNMSYLQFLHLLFVHGCLHLKGYDHGSTMEALEVKYTKAFFRG
jgi:rRNA maturation RNase YbeY